MNSWTTVVALVPECAPVNAASIMKGKSAAGILLLTTEGICISLVAPAGIEPSVKVIRLPAEQLEEVHELEAPIILQPSTTVLVGTRN